MQFPIAAAQIAGATTSTYCLEKQALMYKYTYGKNTQIYVRFIHKGTFLFLMKIKLFEFVEINKRENVAMKNAK